MDVGIINEIFYAIGSLSDVFSSLFLSFRVLILNFFGDTPFVNELLNMLEILPVASTMLDKSPFTYVFFGTVGVLCIHFLNHIRSIISGEK